MAWRFIREDVVPLLLLLMLTVMVTMLCGCAVKTQDQGAWELRFGTAITIETRGPTAPHPPAAVMLEYEDWIINMVRQVMAEEAAAAEEEDALKEVAISAGGGHDDGLSGDGHERPPERDPDP